MHHDDHGTLDTVKAAVEDLDSVVAMTRDLVRIPSRGGIDPYDPIVDYVEDWLTDHHLPAKLLTDTTGAAVGLTCEIRGRRPGQRWVLDACLDTAPFGDETAWSHPPTSAAIENGWLWGRGSADSKSGAAIFCHLAARIAADVDDLRGALVLLFDVDEHTGNFGGARRYLIQLLYTTPLPDGVTSEFPLTGKLTVTAVHGGEGFSLTPDLCTLNVDIRTTPRFDSEAAAHHLELRVREIDNRWPDTRPTLIQLDTRWPAYALDEHSPLRSALLASASAAGVDVTAKIAGPSNIGNYLAGLQIPATAGFGAAYTGLHGTDERIQISSIPAVHATYHAAAHELLLG